MLGAAMMHRPMVLLGLAAGLSACAADKEAATETVPTWHADIAPIVQSRCVSCHQAGEIAPFALSDYSDAALIAGALAGSVEARTMPPWGAEPGHRDYLRDPSLSDEQIALFRAWADAGAPEGDPSQAADPLPALESPVIEVDEVLRSELPYTVQGAPDDYRCFVVDWPETTETRYVTGFTADVDNPLVVHHVAAFLFRPDGVLGESVFDTLAAWEELDDRPGYTCYGGPGGDSSTQVPAQQLGQWVPGMGDLAFPQGTGIEVPPGSKVVLQIHYFHPGSTEELDQTGLGLEVADSVVAPGAFAPWLSGTWPTGGMEIPAGEASVEHTAEGDPRTFFEFLVGGLDLSDGFDIHSALFHMHKLGVRGELEVTHADGSTEMLVAVEPWDFDWQRVYELAEPVAFRDGDSLRVTCTFDNSADNPETGGEPIDVNWGEGSLDEMCVGNLFVSVPTGG